MLKSQLTQPCASSLFPATDWATINAAGSDDPGAHPATVRICEAYWQPTYHFVRRTWPRKSPDEALEATHEFFARRLEKHDICNVDPHRRFRNWLQGSVSNFLRNLWRAQQREHERVVSLDGAGVEARAEMEPRSTLDPLRLLDRKRALALLDRAHAQLEREYAARDAAEFARHARLLLVPGEGDGTYAELEERWGIGRGTLKVRLYSMRRRLGTLVCLELGVSPDDDEAVERALGELYEAIAVKEDQPCPKSKAPPAPNST
jgi:DNA-directed RNA polymerase specialized sigma24 family protein